MNNKKQAVDELSEYILLVLVVISGLLQGADNKIYYTSRKKLRKSKKRKMIANTEQATEFPSKYPHKQTESMTEVLNQTDKAMRVNDLIDCLINGVIELVSESVSQL